MQDWWACRFGECVYGEWLSVAPGGTEREDPWIRVQERMRFIGAAMTLIDFGASGGLTERGVRWAIEHHTNQHGL